MPQRTFLKRWNDCRACPLGELARKHVIGEGSLPADMFILGEAPGRTEDLLGRPFVGQAGRLLKEMLHESFRGLDKPLSHYITNTVACAPWVDRHRITYREPTKKEAEACQERVSSLLSESQARLIVYVGQVSKRYFKPPKGIISIIITHPAAILRKGIAPTSSISYHKNILLLKEAYQQLNF